MVIQLDTCLQLQTQNPRISWIERDAQGSSKFSSWPCTWHPKNTTKCLRVLSKHFLNSSAETISLGSLFQCRHTLGGKNLFLILNLKLLQHNFRPFPCVLVTGNQTQCQVSAPFLYSQRSLQTPMGSPSQSLLQSEQTK